VRESGDKKQFIMFWCYLNGSPFSYTAERLWSFSSIPRYTEKKRKIYRKKRKIYRKEKEDLQKEKEDL